DKVLFIEAKQRESQKQAQALAQQVSILSEKTDAVERSSTAIQALKAIQTFDEIDWKSLALKVQSLLEEKRSLEEGNQDLMKLRLRLEEVKAKIKEQDLALGEATDGQGGLKNEILNCQNLLVKCHEDSE